MRVRATRMTMLAATAAAIIAPAALGARIVLAAPAGPTFGGNCTVSPNPAYVGADFTISGSGYKSNQGVTIAVTSAGGTSYVWQYTDANGNLSVVWRVYTTGSNTVSVYDSVTTTFITSCSFETVQAPDDDGDGVPTGSDNCPTVYNPDQRNSDDNFVDMSPPKTFDDLTWIHSDEIGDACDSDDDNDGLSDSVEGQSKPCSAASRSTNPLLRDSDGDRRLDKAECDLGYDPASASSVPPLGVIGPDADGDLLPDALDPRDNDADSDDDGLSDGIEFRYYNSDIQNRNSDGDACDDAREVASINNDTGVTSADLAQIAQSFGSGPSYLANFDTNKDGTISSADLTFVAQRFGAC